MPATQAESPHRPTRRSRRPPRKSAIPGPSQIRSVQCAELSTDASPERQAEKPTRILRRGEEDVIEEDLAPANLHALPPHTPPRPRSMYEGYVSQQPNGNDSAPEISQIKRRALKHQGRKQSGAVSPIQVPNGSPISTPRTQSLTPGRMNQTLAKAYAGPTFHASPAASSLPIPKFFSKSVPNVDKTASLKTMMQQETSQTTSESEASPPQENKQPAQDRRAREESPLDIFFRADREAKARRDSPDKGANTTDKRAQLNPLLSESQASPRHHTRQPTDGSVGGMFPLEMDGTRAENPSSPLYLARPSTNASSGQSHPSSSMMEAERKEEERKAQTAALKHLIHSPRPHLPQSRFNGQRPPSSSLRKEVAMSNSPEQTHVPDYPGTPTPSRVHKPSTRVKAYAQSHQDGYNFTYSPLSTSNQSSNSTPTRNEAYAKSMEDDLRRILKLDVLGEGVTPIQS